jgi:hypothetical protein
LIVNLTLEEIEKIMQFISNYHLPTDHIGRSRTMNERQAHRILCEALIGQKAPQIIWATGFKLSSVSILEFETSIL